MSLKKKFNVLKVPPLARNFSEATELVKLARSEGVMFAVASPGRFTQMPMAMRAFMSQNQAEQFVFVLAAAGSRVVGGEPEAKWRIDPVLAGGGVVLYDSWEIIDQVVWNFGVPQQIYCVTGSTASDRRQRLYLTEDSAVVTMKFSDTLSGSILAGRAAAYFGKERQKWLTAHTQNALIRVDDKHFEVTDSQGQCLQRDDFDDDCLGRMRKVLENFGSNLLWRDQNPLVGAAADNLGTMAVIEAAYLSSRTGMPEEPGRILKIT